MMINTTWPITEKLIHNALNLVEQLYQQLVTEADTLKQSPSAELVNQIASNKKQLVLQLEQFHIECGQILAMATLPHSLEGINLYFQQAEAAGFNAAELKSHWDQIQALCTLCKVLNEQNGMSIELLAHHTKRSSHILKGKSPSPSLYGPDGTTQSEPSNHSHNFILV